MWERQTDNDYQNCKISSRSQVYRQIKIIKLSFWFIKTTPTELFCYQQSICVVQIRVWLLYVFFDCRWVEGERWSWNNYYQAKAEISKGNSVHRSEWILRAIQLLWNEKYLIWTVLVEKILWNLYFSCSRSLSNHKTRVWYRHSHSNLSFRDHVCLFLLPFWCHHRRQLVGKI